MNNVLPDDIALFIAERIDSVAELEGLLILRQDPHTKWQVNALASRLYISEGDTAELLRLLCDAGLAAKTAGDPPTYYYAPTSAELTAAVDRLANIYSKHVVPVANLIHSKPKHRVQGFADAFKFRKDG